VDSDGEIMMEMLQEYEAEAAAHLQCWHMGFAFLMQLRQQLSDAVPRRGGSRPGKSSNKICYRDSSAMLLHSDYFAGDATNTPKEFRQRVKMNKQLFMKILQRVREQEDYFKYKKDCTEKWGSCWFRNARLPYGALHMELHRTQQWTIYAWRVNIYR
jgi:hypothetical protein